MSLYRCALLSSLLLLGALMTLGLNLQLGRRPLSGRRLHHVLYFLVGLFTVLTLTLALAAGQPWWPWALLLLPLLGMSRTRPGRPAHWQLAVVTAALYLAAAYWAW